MPFHSDDPLPPFDAVPAPPPLVPSSPTEQPVVPAPTEQPVAPAPVERREVAPDGPAGGERRQRQKRREPDVFAPLVERGDTLIVFVDIVGSVQKGLQLGEVDGARMVMQRLNDIEGALRAACPSVERKSSAGDEIMLFAKSDPAVMFHCAVQLQAAWMAWPTGGLPAKIAIGLGSIEQNDDGEYRATTINLTRRILDLCPQGGVVVTEAVRARLQAVGLTDKLIRVEGKLKGFPGIETFYEADGKWVIEESARQPAAQRQAAAVGAAGVAVPILDVKPLVNYLEHKSLVPNTFWQLLGLGFFVMLIAFFIYSIWFKA